MRTNQEVQSMIDFIEEAYPEGVQVNMRNPIVAYELGILAGLKTSIGQYESFNELNWMDFVESTFNQSEGRIPESTSLTSDSRIKEKTIEGNGFSCPKCGEELIFGECANCVPESRDTHEKRHQEEA